MTNDRLNYIKNYFNQQQNVKVICPRFETHTSKGTLVRYFEDIRFGYKFTRGQAIVKREDVHLFESHYPNWIIEEITEDQA